MSSFAVNSKSKEELIDITNEIKQLVKDSAVSMGLCCVYIPHTTAAVTINENADRDVKFDIIKGVSSLDLEKVRYDHAEGNSAAHIKSSLIGCSETLIIENSSLMLGTWQGIFFCEFDGPRTRQVIVKIVKG